MTALEMCCFNLDTLLISVGSSASAFDLYSVQR